jgi:hypothetical protein
LLALLRYQTTLPKGIDRAAADAVLAPALGRARRALVGADHDQVLHVLTMMADMIQCSLPEETGIQVYVAALQSVGYPALRHACVEVAKTHLYPRLPLPAEILAAAAGPQAELTYWHGALTRACKLLEEP